jgi:hypothetical protein
MCGSSGLTSQHSRFQDQQATKVDTALSRPSGSALPIGAEYSE